MPTITNVDIVVIQPLVALIFGILIILIPRLLNYLIAIYLIMIGIIGLWPQITSMTHTTDLLPHISTMMHS